MPANTFGIFKGSYKGHGLYWTPEGYNTDGGTSFPTMLALKKAIDNNVIEQQKQEDALLTQKITDGKCILLHKNSDNTVTATIPNHGTREYDSTAQARQAVFQLEEEFNRDTVWV
jgi:hypothetical protein